MAEGSWIARSALSHRDRQKARSDRRQSSVRVNEQPSGVSLHVAAFRGRAQMASDLLSDYLRCAVTLEPKVVRSEDVILLWSGPSQWLLIAPEEQRILRQESLRNAIGSCCAIVDQSDARVRFQIAGADARLLLAKLVSVDLYKSVFAIDTCMLTALGHVPALLWRTADRDNAPVFDFAVPRSYATDVLELLHLAGSEFAMVTVLAEWAKDGSEP